MSALPIGPNLREDPDSAVPRRPTLSVNVRTLAACVLDGDRAAVQLHLARGASPGRLGLDGFAPLHLAASQGDPRMLKLLLQAGARVDVRSAQPGGRVGATALHVATAVGHVDVVRLLLEAGAPPDVRDEAGYTPLQLAAERGDLPIVKCLLLAGAAHDREVAAHTALGLARRGRHLAVVALLRQMGAR